MSTIKSYKWTIASAIAVLVLLLIPSQAFQKAPQSLIGLDKFVHAILFGAMTAVFCAEHRALKKMNPKFLLSLIIISAFAFLTEISQLLTITRHFDLKDFGADTIGIATALVVMRIATVLS
jgi:VanZ family protein